ncbi:hypothetical protein MESS2_390002 [Mesorhizobium metallidurans STM 2683]|uniref:Uncharacterized protein n=1 Tax=Mesorhizobium metallidurans STM 2683 TaxID=1297569 RepID=M5EPV7_9HYPH|nr:hypothetical protein MESS2_390002 [Mesorhizobium metallidurans STM 2683]
MAPTCTPSSSHWVVGISPAFKRKPGASNRAGFFNDPAKKNLALPSLFRFLDGSLVVPGVAEIRADIAHRGKLCRELSLSA